MKSEVDLRGIGRSEEEEEEEDGESENAYRLRMN